MNEAKKTEENNQNQKEKGETKNEKFNQKNRIKIGKSGKRCFCKNSYGSIKRKGRRIC